DLGGVGRDDRDVVRAGEIHERRPGEEPGIQPQRAIGDEKIEAGRAQKIATHGAASSAARGEHSRNNGRGSYKSWALNDDRSNFCVMRFSGEADMFMDRQTVSRRGVPWTCVCAGPDERTTTSCGEPPFSRSGT